MFGAAIQEQAAAEEVALDAVQPFFFVVVVGTDYKTVSSSF